MELNKPKINSVLQQIAKQNEWLSEIAKIAQSSQVLDACLKASSCYQSSVCAKMIEQTNVLAKIAAPVTWASWASSQSQFASAVKIVEEQQKQLRDMVESPMLKMIKTINESSALYNTDIQSLWKTSFDFLSQLDLEERNHLADLAIQEVPVLENESADDIPEVAEEEITQWKELFPSIKDLSIDQIKNFLIRLVTIISIILNIKGCADADIAHQDAVQAHQDATQAHQDFLESQNATQAIQINNPADSVAKK